MSQSRQKKAKPEQGSTKHTGMTSRPLSFPAFEIKQSDSTMYMFKAKASILFRSFSINRRVQDKDEGYQRALSPARVQAITRYITQRKKPIPGAIIICVDKATFKNGMITIPSGTDVGWVIDGQHRLAGAEEASRLGTDVELPVVAFLNLSKEKQIEQFIIINKEAKSVPTSLYLDLLRELPPSKNPVEIAKERSADLASQLRRDEDSPFYERIVVIGSPKVGQISLVNFVRKISNLVIPEKGQLSVYTEPEQQAVISNYYKALQQVFPSDFDAKDSIFFKTIGFGALWNVFPTVFNLSLKNYKGFRVKDVIEIFKRVESFDFSQWKQFGTGNQAEQSAGDDLRTSITFAFKEENQTGLLSV